MSGTIADLLLETSEGTPSTQPGAAVHIIGMEGLPAAGADPQGAMLVIDSLVDTATDGLNGSSGPTVVGRAFRGSLASPTNPSNDDVLLRLHATSLLESISEIGIQASIGRRSRCGTLQFKAAENWTDTSHGTKLEIDLTPDGQLNESVVLSIAPDGAVTIPGNLTVSGTINGTGMSGGALDFQTYNLPTGITGALQTHFHALRKDTTVRQFVLIAYVGTTNNASNYWQIKLQRVDNNGVLATLSTNGQAASNVFRLDSGAIAVAVTAATMKGLNITTAKVGSPGALNLYAVNVYAD